MVKEIAKDGVKKMGLVHQGKIAACAECGEKFCVLCHVQGCPKCGSVHIRYGDELKKVGKLCEFSGYLGEDGMIKILAESEGCRRAIIAAGKELGVDVGLVTPEV